MKYQYEFLDGGVVGQIDFRDGEVYETWVEVHGKAPKLMVAAIEGWWEDCAVAWHDSHVEGATT